MLAYKHTDIRLEADQYTAEERRKIALESVERLAAFRKKLASRATEPLPDPVDVLNKMREERVADFDRVLRGEE